ncbi:MAG: hypothetical protein Aurels2KO_32600 [Aureliella sp.]
MNFQSFNSYHAQVMGITTYSFAVNLGCLYTEIPRSDGFPICKTSKYGELRPQEFECQFRGSIKPTVDQEIGTERGVWFIDPEGNLLDAAIADVTSQIFDYVVSWYEQFSDVQTTFRILTEDDSDMESVWGFGNKPSPARNYLIGYFALKLGKPDIASSHLGMALESGCFEQSSDRIRNDIRCITNA